MAKAYFDPMIKWIRGRIGNLVYRRAHNGKISVYPVPDMSRVKWSNAQRDHRENFREAVLYASAAIADPEIRLVYVQMAIENHRDPRRPYHMAFQDYYYQGNDLLWKKHMGDQEKPQKWIMDRYAFYLSRQKPQWGKHYGKQKRRR
jgi:hypothetical protein